MSERRGLPSATKMKHDAHFVEELAARHTDAIGRQIAIGELSPNPQQPRQEMGNLDELVASIHQVGVLEPLLVRPDGDEGYLIISGERRFRAARQAGLEKLPCIVLDVADAEVLEIALIENLQRQDLSPFEEAEGLQALIDQYGYTHEQISERIGRSRSTVTESLSLIGMPRYLRKRLDAAGVRTKSTLLEIARQGSEAEMAELTNRVIEEGLTRDQVRDLRRPEDEEADADEDDAPPPVGSRPPRRLTYRSDQGVTVTLYLSGASVSLDDVSRTLREAIEYVEATGLPD